MIPVAEARAFVLSSCRALTPQRVPAGEAHGHVLAEAVHATDHVPPFANSAMDGYALRAADTAVPPARLRVVGSLMAGDHPTTTVSDGEAVRIMTGAPLPDGADAVCMVERTRSEEGGAAVVVEASVDPGTNVRRAGEDVGAGDEVFGPGTVLGPAHLGVLSSVGIETLLVHPRPSVGVLSTGDELVEPGRRLAHGKIRDANRPALLAQVRDDGFRAIDLGVAGDDEKTLADRLEDAASWCDAVVVSGGVSVGDRDVMKTVLEKMGGASARSVQVAVKPAKPFAFGLLDPFGTPVFGLPGNPVSALVSYELFVRPALRSMAGCATLDRPRLSAVADAELTRRRDGKLHLLRVVVTTAPGGLPQVRPAGGQESHLLRVMASANGLALLPDGEGVARGERVEVLLLDSDRLSAVAQEPW